jgi:hypothetical protein
LFTHLADEPQSGQEQIVEERLQRRHPTSEMGLPLRKPAFGHHSEFLRARHINKQF